ncbi:MAG: UDP-N-acetylmuramoyl-L-alanyl-D-glutamate--2,6-diaminopimelate ligase [Muribaculaceae bacterium]|nr:UDP-N-acetylmuramoyl-L-alanyl-D-glutamate--2,6-diaminopimelate ligase [Muribaculaceae bacterium]
MVLSALLSAIITEETIGYDNIEITSLTADSRECHPGTLFIAVRGVNVDGHNFIKSAVDNGAAAVVCEEIPNDINNDITWIKVANSSVALGFLASQWFGNPSRKLSLIGVTGTNGKTTIATLIYEMARLNNRRAGLLSTVVNKIEDEEIPSTHTTPDPIELNGLLSRMVDAGCEVAAMEVSSHAAHQHRIAGLHFAGGIFTNLTRDHLDYHKTFEAYLAAKQSFFDLLPKEAFALTNIDDRNGMIIVQNTRAKVYTYSVRSEADFRGHIVENRIDGMSMPFNGTEVETLFTGRFNASNLTAVFGASVLMGYDREKIPVEMSRLVPVAGRFQTFRSRNGITAIVDYAHTPDALINVLDAIRDIVGRTCSVITVCGCGGNRDKGKRPLMAVAAVRRSDKVILTSDNPRNEDPTEIINDMRAGLTPDELAATLSITDRREAIRTATALAKPGDVILIAGKGHETYQIIGPVTNHFDDREEITAAFANI